MTSLQARLSTGLIVALALLTALPAAERGPVLLSAFCRLAFLRGLEGGMELIGI